MNHDARCDRDLCHPDCPIRKQAIVNDRPYPGQASTIPAYELWTGKKE